MNLNKIKQERGIALSQAAISEEKMNYWEAHKAPWKTTMYSIRAKALRCYAKELEKQIKNHEKRQFKKQSN